MGRILVRNALVVATQDERLGEIPGGDVLIDGDAILAVGAGLAVPPGPDLEVLDASGCVVIPGFINTHHHLYQVLTRNLEGIQDAKLFDWLLRLYEVWRHIDVADVAAAATAGLGELLLTGCTTSADHHYLCPECVDGDLFAAEVAAAAALGIRFQLTRGSMSLGQSAGGLPPDSVVQDEDAILSDCERVIDRFHDPKPRAMCRVALAPCSPFSVTPDLMRRTGELARSRGVRLHTHLAETRDEERFCLEKFGRRPVDLIEDLGWLGPEAWFAHCVHVNDDEMRRMGRAGAGVAHCPVSNLRLGSGIAPVPRMLELGVPVGLAVDGSASNDSSNMLREVQAALLVHRVGTGVAAMPARRALAMATRGGARVLGRDDLGVIAPGFAADLAVFDLTGLAYAGALHDPVAALLFCGIDARARFVVVNGAVVVRERRLTRVDERWATEQAQDASRRLLLAARHHS